MRNNKSEFDAMSEVRESMEIILSNEIVNQWMIEFYNFSLLII